MQTLALTICCALPLGARLSASYSPLYNCFLSSPLCSFSASFPTRNLIWVYCALQWQFQHRKLTQNSNEWRKRTLSASENSSSGPAPLVVNPLCYRNCWVRGCDGAGLGGAPDLVEKNSHFTPWNTSSCVVIGNKPCAKLCLEPVEWEKLGVRRARLSRPPQSLPPRQQGRGTRLSPPVWSAGRSIILPVTSQDCVLGPVWIF